MRRKEIKQIFNRDDRIIVFRSIRYIEDYVLKTWDVKTLVEHVEEWLSNLREAACPKCSETYKIPPGEQTGMMCPHCNAEVPE